MTAENVELAIIGAGPAGVAAAIAASKYSSSSVIVDEQPRPGGRLLCQVHKNPTKPGEWTNGPAIASDMIAQAQAAGVEILSRTEVWGIWPSWSVMLGGAGRGSIEVVKARAVLVATGAAESGLPFPGWTRPGVITAGAAQTMMMQHRLLPGQRVLVVGTDPLAISVAMDMAEYGAKVVGIVLPPPGPASGAMACPEQAVANVARLSNFAPNPALKAFGSVFTQAARVGAYLFPKKGLTVQHVPFLLRRCIVDTSGANELESVTLADMTAGGEIVSGSEQEVEVDTVCISGGLYPLAELAEACGCKFTYVDELGGRVPLYGTDMQTTQAGLFVSGSSTGVEGAQVALAQGRMAAIGVAGYCGRISPQEVTSLLEKAASEVEAARDQAIICFNPDVVRGRNKQAQCWKEYQAAISARN